MKRLLLGNIKVKSVNNSNIFKQSLFEHPLSLENALVRNEKNVKTKPKFLSENISFEQVDNQIYLNLLSHTNPNDLNNSQISGSPATCWSLSYDNNPIYLLQKLKKRLYSYWKKNILDDLFPKKSKKKDEKCLLRREWTRVSSKKLAIVNKFCCIALWLLFILWKGGVFIDCRLLLHYCRMQYERENISISWYETC